MNNELLTILKGKLCYTNDHSKILKRMFRYLFIYVCTVGGIRDEAYVYPLHLP